MDQNKRAWCEGGIRYDDHCVGCGATADVDNATDLCEACFGPPRAPDNDPVIGAHARLERAGLAEPLVFEFEPHEYAQLLQGREPFLEGVVRGFAQHHAHPVTIVLTYRGETVATVFVTQRDIDDASARYADAD